MVITRRTKTKDVLPFLTADRAKEIMDAVDEYPLDRNIIELTIGEFMDCLEDGYAERFLKERYLYKAFGKIKCFRRQMEEISQFLKMNETKPNGEQERAALGIVFPTFGEQMLMTVTEYFHLANFDEAEEIKLHNYLLIMKKNTSENKFKANYEKIISDKIKRQNGKRK